MWYVTFISEYPIYEPAEGGYYYAGTTINEERVFRDWRDARQYYNKAKKEFVEYFGEPLTDEQWDDYDRHPWKYRDRVYEDRWRGRVGIYHSTQYIGSGHELTITKKPRKEKGWVPYE